MSTTSLRHGWRFSDVVIEASVRAATYASSYRSTRRTHFRDLIARVGRDIRRLVQNRQRRRRWRVQRGSASFSVRTLSSAAAILACSIKWSGKWELRDRDIPFGSVVAGWCFRTLTRPRCFLPQSCSPDWLSSSRKVRCGLRGRLRRKINEGRLPRWRARGSSDSVSLSSVASLSRITLTLLFSPLPLLRPRGRTDCPLPAQASISVLHRATSRL